MTRSRTLSRLRNNKATPISCVALILLAACSSQPAMAAQSHRHQQLEPNESPEAGSTSDVRVARLPLDGDLRWPRLWG